MAYEKTWQFAMNQQVPTAQTASYNLMWQYHLWWLKQFVLGNIAMTDATGTAVATPQGVWTVAGSSDATSGAMDGVDRWGATFDATKINAAGSTTAARSWIVLHNAGLGIWLTIDLNSGANYNDVKVQFGLATVAPTGGSATARPTSTNESISETGVNGSIVCATANALNTGLKCHGILATDGSFTVMSSQDGSGIFQSAINVHKLTDLNPADTSSPVIASIEGVVQPSGGAHVGVWRFTYDGNNGVSNHGSMLSTPFQWQAARGFYVNGSDDLAALIPHFGNSPNNFHNFLPYLLGSGVRPGDSAFRTQKLYLGSHYYNGREKGRLQDILLSQNPGDGIVNPTSGTPQWMTAGCMVLPTNTVPSL